MQASELCVARVIFLFWNGYVLLCYVCCEWEKKAAQIDAVSLFRTYFFISRWQNLYIIMRRGNLVHRVYDLLKWSGNSLMTQIYNIHKLHDAKREKMLDKYYVPDCENNFFQDSGLRNFQNPLKLQIVSASVFSSTEL